MEHVIAHAPTFTTLEFRLNEGETISAQPGCMLAMTPNFEVKAGMGSHMKGKPGVRRGRYYCAFLIDYDGNNVEAGVYG